MKYMETYGREILTRRFTAVDTGGEEISFPEHSVKSFMVHYEGNTEVMVVQGNVSFTGSADAHITSDGTTVIFPVGGVAGTVLCTIKAPTGTVDISVIAWR